MTVVSDAGSLAPMQQRATEAVMRCVARYGVSKTTLDDVAREAGCARATLYRYFPNKSQLLRVAVASEVAGLAAELAEIGACAPTLDDAVVAVVTHASRRIVGHDALQFVLRCEPETLLPYLAFAAGDRFLAAAGDVVARSLLAHLSPERAARAGEWVARVALSYLTPDGSPVDMTDERQVRELVRTFVRPGLPTGSADPITR